MKLALILMGILVCQLSVGQNQRWDFGPDSTPVSLDFESVLHFPAKKLKGRYFRRKNIRLSARDQKAVDKAVYQQILHLYGVFTYHEIPINFSVMSGSIREISDAQIFQIEVTNKGLTVRYRYHDKATFYEDLLEGAATRDIEFYLPTDPSTVYQLGFPKIPVLNPKTRKPRNLCTSPLDDSEAAFFYYWNPHQEGCPKKIFEGIHLVKARITRLEETSKTYPDYRRLYHSPLDIHVAVGKDESLFHKGDLGRLSYQHTYQNLMNFKGPDGNQPLFTELHSFRHRTKILSYQTDLFSAKIHLYFVDPDSGNWDRFIRPILKDSSVFIYSGHSSEGEYFDPERLFRKRGLNKSRYQIFFFNACSTQSYFHTNWFGQKKSKRDPNGTLGLEILTNVIGAPFLSTPEAIEIFEPTSDTLLISALLGLRPDGQPLERMLSWQEIITSISDQAGYDYTALPFLFGDEDNPNQPMVNVPRAVDTYR